MKVLFLNIYDDPAISGGGVETTLHHLTRGLLSRGIEPVIVGTTTENGLHKIERDGVRIWRVGEKNIYPANSKVPQNSLKKMLWHGIDSYNFKMQPYLQSILNIERPDVISMHNLSGWSVAVWNTISKSKIPMVQVLHDSYIVCPRSQMRKHEENCSKQCFSCRLYRLPHRKLSNKLSAVVGVSQYILDRHLQQGYFQEVPIKIVINNARDGNTLENDKISKDEHVNAIRFGFIGRLSKEKGLEPLLNSFYNAKIEGAELWIAGTGNPDYVNYLNEKWGSEQVKFLGRKRQSDFYPEVDVIVVPSLWNDTFPGVVFESLAFGKPVIGANRGGIPEMINNGCNGILFEPKNQSELVSAMRKLAFDKDLRKTMGKAARSSAEKYLDMNAWLDKYVNIYRKVLSGD